jgi:hypothetical protein
MSAKDRPHARKAVEICYGKQGLDRLDNDRCPRCGSANKDFRDRTSIDEHNISGLCQPCQDIMFAPSEDE